MGGAFGLALVMIFFWMPETAYVRIGVVNLDKGSNNVRYTHRLIEDNLVLILLGDD
jgi:hypothetical protein